MVTNIVSQRWWLSHVYLPVLSPNSGREKYPARYIPSQKVQGLCPADRKREKPPMHRKQILLI